MVPGKHEKFAPLRVVETNISTVLMLMCYCQDYFEQLLVNADPPF